MLDLTPITITEITRYNGEKIPLKEPLILQPSVETKEIITARLEAVNSELTSDTRKELILEINHELTTWYEELIANNMKNVLGDDKEELRDNLLRLVK